MPSGAFTVARGRINGLVQRAFDGDPANAGLIAVALSAVEADATLKTRRTLAEVFAEAGNIEATNDGYARLPIPTTFGGLDVDDFWDWTIANFFGAFWENVAAGDRWVKLLICYDPDTTAGDDTSIIPLTFHDFFRAPRGQPMISITLGGSRALHGSSGFYVAAKE